MLYVWYVHLQRQSLFIGENPILSSEKMLYKNYDRKGSDAKKKRISDREPQVAWRQDELMRRSCRGLF
jgi:hypothetical protein